MRLMGNQGLDVNPTSVFLSPVSEFKTSLDRRIRLSNQIAILLIFCSAPYVLIFYLMGYTLQSSLIIPLDISFLLALLLNRMGFISFGRSTVLLAGNLAAFIYALFLGEGADAHLLFFFIYWNSLNHFRASRAFFDVWLDADSCGIVVCTKNN